VLGVTVLLGAAVLLGVVVFEPAAAAAPAAPAATMAVAPTTVNRYLRPGIEILPSGLWNRDGRPECPI
jgi:hypothetical protein